MQICTGWGKISGKRSGVMRRKDREVTDFQTMVDIMSRCRVCRLALNDGEVPYLLPVNFGRAGP